MTPRSTSAPSITRTVYDPVPPKVVDDITSDERADREAIIQSLCSWGLDWAAKTGAHILALET